MPFLPNLSCSSIAAVQSRASDTILQCSFVHLSVNFWTFVPLRCTIALHAKLCFCSYFLFQKELFVISHFSMFHATLSHKPDIRESLTVGGLLNTMLTTLGHQTFCFTVLAATSVLNPEMGLSRIFTPDCLVVINLKWLRRYFLPSSARLVSTPKPNPQNQSIFPGSFLFPFLSDLPWIFSLASTCSQGLGKKYPSSASCSSVHWRFPGAHIKSDSCIQMKTCDCEAFLLDSSEALAQNMRKKVEMPHVVFMQGWIPPVSETAYFCTTSVEQWPFTRPIWWVQRSMERTSWLSIAFTLGQDTPSSIFANLLLRKRHELEFPIGKKAPGKHKRKTHEWNGEWEENEWQVRANRRWSVLTDGDGLLLNTVLLSAVYLSNDNCALRPRWFFSLWLR